jgi:hypothetical protein
LIDRSGDHVLLKLFFFSVIENTGFTHCMF